MKKLLLSAFILAALLVLGCNNPVTVVDPVAPTVSSTSPANLDVDVSVSRSVSAIFDKAMDPVTMIAANFTLSQAGTLVAGAVSYVDNIITFNPTADLAFNSAYIATLTTGCTDFEGTPLAAEKVWSFTTAAAADLTAPTVSSTLPADAATEIAKNITVQATFSEDMDIATLTGTSFTLMQGSTPVAGTVSTVLKVASFNPSVDLLANTLYTATVTVAAKDMAGNALAAEKVWSFTTSDTIAKGPAAVDLGTAGNYAILAKTAISTVPASAITGDIAISPAAASFITGFSLVADSTNVFSTSTQVVGQVFAANYAVPTPSNLTTAISNMETAYTNAAGRITPDFLDLGTGAIGGRTLEPGLYKWNSTVTIDSDVTINGGAKDVWIFQITGGITQATNTRVTLTGGALPQNIFWQVADDVAIGTSAHMEGIVLCQTAINMGNGASVNGRLLSQTAVALNATTVVEPTL